MEVDKDQKKATKMALFEAEQVMIRLMILYGCAVIFGFLASVPMIYHVSPISECLLFSTVARSGKLFYGHYASKYNFWEKAPYLADFAIKMVLIV